MRSRYITLYVYKSRIFHVNHFQSAIYVMNKKKSPTNQMVFEIKYIIMCVCVFFCCDNGNVLAFIYRHICSLSFSLNKPFMVWTEWKRKKSTWHKRFMSIGGASLLPFPMKMKKEKRKKNIMYKSDYYIYYWWQYMIKSNNH